MSLDITLCSGKGCNMRVLCHRYDKNTIKNYSAKDKQYCSYFVEPPFLVKPNGEFKCLYFWGSQEEKE